MENISDEIAEPNGPANGSQQPHSEADRTSQAAGSCRRPLSSGRHSRTRMKTHAIAFLLITTGVLWAEPSEQQLRLAYQMQEAVLKTQDIQKVQHLLDAGIDINSPIGCGTFSPLDGAVHVQNPELLKFLLTHGAKPRGRELADAAFASGPQQGLQMVQALLDAGIPPDTRSDTSNALIRATYRGNSDLIRLLLSKPGTKLDETDIDGFTALMWAVKHGSQEIVDLLLQAGASASFANERGETAATIAQQEIEKQRTIISKLQSKPK